jgi:exonuclease SbcD
MLNRTVRILLVADTHLGFDFPFKPRINRRRRGHDFFANFDRALRPALDGEVDLVVHGGDLLFRTRIHDALLQLAMEPLLKVAEAGVPVYLVPGNHERSRIPLQIWTVHPNLHIFHRPQTFVHQIGGLRVALSGFPFDRRVREDFPELVLATGYEKVEADIRLLCIHQAVEGAAVGPSDYTFRRGSDVIRGSSIPRAFTAVLAGHIHRSQILVRDLQQRPMPAPVIYPGSVERTAFAERFEMKHYAIVSIEKQSEEHQPIVHTEFVPLPARPMITMNLDVDSQGVEEIIEGLQEDLSAEDPESVVNLRISGNVTGEFRSRLTAAKLRDIAPQSMNVSLRYLDDL